MFKVQGCQITATVEGGKVSALRMELGPKCQADLTQFVGTYAPAPGQPLTLGAFEASSGGGLSYSADCLSMCGNAADPSVYAHWEGPHAVDFKEVLLEVTLVSDAAINAADQWATQMQKAEGDDYVMETRFNCDQKYTAAAQKAFEKSRSPQSPSAPASRAPAAETTCGNPSAYGDPVQADIIRALVPR